MTENNSKLEQPDESIKQFTKMEVLIINIKLFINLILVQMSCYVNNLYFEKASDFKKNTIFMRS